MWDVANLIQEFGHQPDMIDVLGGGIHNLFGPEDQPARHRHRGRNRDGRQREQGQRPRARAAVMNPPPEHFIPGPLDLDMVMHDLFDAGMQMPFADPGSPQYHRHEFQVQQYPPGYANAAGWEQPPLYAASPPAAAREFDDPSHQHAAQAVHHGVGALGMHQFIGPGGIFQQMGGLQEQQVHLPIRPASPPNTREIGVGAIMRAIEEGEFGPGASPHAPPARHPGRGRGGDRWTGG